MSRTTETRHLERVSVNMDQIQASVCNNKQRWNDDKCGCECKELVDKGVCEKGSIWNPSNCECKCDKSCDVGEYLDYQNCQCEKKLVDKLVEKCAETVEEVLKLVKLAKITLPENENQHKCSSCTLYIALYIVLFSIIFTINVGNGCYFLYVYWRLKKDVHFKFGTHTQQFNECNSIEFRNRKSQTNEH